MALLEVMPLFPGFHNEANLRADPTHPRREVHSQGFKPPLILQHHRKRRRKAREGLVPITVQSMSTT